MPSAISENRRRYDLDDGVALPTLTDLLAGHAGATPVVAGAAVVQHLEATYFDTADHRLAEAQLVLFETTGGDDAGWHLEILGANGRQPVRVPVEHSATTVPASLRNLVWASTRGEALRPVARIVTERTVQRLIDASGQEVIEVTDDHVRAERLADTTAKNSVATWRTVGVELKGREPEWLDAVEAGLRDVGVRDAEGQHGLASVWDDGDAVLNGGRSRRTVRHPSPKSPAGHVVLRYVDEQVTQIITSDPLVRLDTPGGVHRMRVATRRLRSALQTFQPVLHSEEVAPLRAELKWLAAELGAARDAEVMRERMLVAMADEESQVHVGAVGTTLDKEMSDAYKAAHNALLTALDSERYHRIVVALHRLVSDPPLAAKADRPAGRVLPRRAARAYARLHALVRQAHEADTLADRDTQLHEARKAAKKARYAGETMADFFGKPAARFATAMEKLQEELGEHQDSVVMRGRIEELARTEITPAAAFAYGRLHAHEERRGDLAVERFEASWRKATKKSLRAWMS